MVTDPMMELVDRGGAYTDSRREGYSRYRANVETPATPWTLPGQRPNRYASGEGKFYLSLI